MKSLIELANRFGSDKGTRTPKLNWGRPHNYADIYQAYFSDLCEAPLTLLEIGAGVLGPNWETGLVGGHNEGGASIRMWREFFPNARIVTIDINPAEFLRDERTETYLVDQGSPESIAAFLRECPDPQFDIIVDDGSHNPEHQQTSLGCLWPSVKPGGIYFIEDMIKNGIGDTVERRNTSDKVASTIEVLTELRDLGKTEQPNQLGDVGSLMGSVKYINLHCPRVNPILVNKSTREKLGKKALKQEDTKVWFEYDDDFPMLAALRKKPVGL